ncbi:hypothetical protein NDU88_003495 [Pleurodeles waltl]|uniref:Uncharacterized protein n=1 Tax=Pleurodeles waltl TaxID=8319 RepID=A0AAV7T5G8_PLEWA|nr:hypothetical protein NDU88_003495 [Pleurodeles waltl]
MAWACRQRLRVGTLTIRPSWRALYRSMDSSVRLLVLPPFHSKQTGPLLKDPPQHLVSTMDKDKPNRPAASQTRMDQYTTGHEQAGSNVDKSPSSEGDLATII